MIDAEVVDSDAPPAVAPQSPAPEWAETIVGPRPETQRRAAELLAAWRNESPDTWAADGPAATTSAAPTESRTADPEPGRATTDADRTDRATTGRATTDADKSDRDKSDRDGADRERADRHGSDLQESGPDEAEHGTANHASPYARARIDTARTDATIAAWLAAEPTPAGSTSAEPMPAGSASAEPTPAELTSAGSTPAGSAAAGPETARAEPVEPGPAAENAPPHARADESDRPASSAATRTEPRGYTSAADTWAAGFTPANQTESALLLAAEENNTDQFLSTLLLARVVVPVPVGTSPHMLPADPAFPWQLEELDGETFISVFTSPERLTEHMRGRLGAETASLSFRFVQLIGAWPDADIAFAVNPGTPVGATLPGSQIVALASWATDVGLRAEPAGEVVLANPAPAAPASSSIMGTNQRDRLTVMQKPIAASQVPIYLERGYDRVHGFVNRLSEVDHLTTPRQLYSSLGLGYPGSEIRPDDREVYVLRWLAHRGDLYRIPYGGPHEAAMRAMQGWVIERPPFRGNGFAPGDGEVIAEFKVDSVRLPHGATLWRLDADGDATLVATFDADGPRWRRAGG